MDLISGSNFINIITGQVVPLQPTPHIISYELLRNSKGTEKYALAIATAKMHKYGHILTMVWVHSSQEITILT